MGSKAISEKHYVFAFDENSSGPGATVDTGEPA
jgi:hypothetical protein